MRIALWNLNMVSIGLSAEPTSHELLSVSHMKRLELIDGAEEVKFRKDLAAESELSPKLLLLTPNAGTQQDRAPQHGFRADSFSGVFETSPFFCNSNMLRLTDLWVPSDSANTEQSLPDNAEAQGHEDRTIFLAGQKRDALEDKHRPFLRALQAQPEKSVTKAESIAGAGTDTQFVR
jgi:hypothetical protein